MLVQKEMTSIGRTSLYPAESSVIGTMQYLLPKENVLPEYLCYVVKYMHLEKYFTGATIPHIYFKDYKKEEFNLDTLDRQKEIVNILGRIECVISSRQQELQKLDELIKARFVELFGDPDNNEKSWDKAEYYVRQHQDNEAIAKLKSNQPLTSEDIKNLENIMWSEIGTKQDYEAEYGEKPLGEFVREIVGLDMTAAKEAFAEYLDETNLDSRQIYFVNQIVEFIVHNGMMKDLSVLQEPPFTDQGSIVEVFTDLSVWMGIRKAIEQVNANALAA